MTAQIVTPRMSSNECRRVRSRRGSSRVWKWATSEPSFRADMRSLRAGKKYAGRQHGGGIEKGQATEQKHPILMRLPWYYTLLAAQRVGHSGKVYAIEPSPYAVERLARTVSRNKLDWV